MGTVNVIAIDGPAASGKSTVGRLLAEELDYLYLDTGCMYRAVTLAALAEGVALDDAQAVSTLARGVTLDIDSAKGHDDGRHYTVWLDGRDVTWDIRSPEVDKNVSLVSSHWGVRQEMVRRQRDFGHRGQIVMVGRDIGTVVMPEAPLKLYITATAAERARRRWQDRRQQGHEEPFATILRDVERRDQIDSNRAHSPLRAAADAIEIDTTTKSVPEIVREVTAMVQARDEQVSL